MNNPITQTAGWKTQYQLTVSTPYGTSTPSGANWYDSGTSVGFSVSPTTVSGGTGTQYVFTGWTGGGDGSYTGSNASSSVTMNNPITETANWKTQYQLTVTSARGTPSGGGWYDSGSSAGFSVSPTTVSGGTGTQYVFTGWTGGGTGSYNGSNSSSSVTMNNPISETANWKTQYYLTAAVNPGAGGTMTPAPPGGWYDIGSAAGVDAAPNPAYVWAGWSGNLSGTVKPNSITMNGPKAVTANFGKEVQITVTTNPAGLGFSVDGTPYTSSQTFTWVENGTHTVSVTTPQSGGSGTQYVYTSWSDGGASSHNYTVPGTNQTVTANFKTQYYLTVSSASGVATGQGWYDSGSSVGFSVSPTTVSGGTGTQYVFTGWTGGGDGSYTGSNASSSVTMNNPITETANWKTQYYLTASVNPGGGGTMTPASPGGWYDNGTAVTVNATANSGYEWVGWSGNLSGSTRPNSITMSGSKSITATFGHSLNVTMIDVLTMGSTTNGTVTKNPNKSVYDHNENVQLTAAPAGGWGFVGWYDGTTIIGTNSVINITMNTNKNLAAGFYDTSKLLPVGVTTDPEGLGIKVDGTNYTSPRTFTWIPGSTHALAAPWEQFNTPDGIRYTFQSWSDGGGLEHNVTVTAPALYTARYSIAYLLVVNSAYGHPTPHGWIGEGQSASFQVETPDSTAPGIRHIFTGWTGYGHNSYTGPNRSMTVVMNNSISETASWKTQFFLASSADPAGGGSVNPASPGVWCDSAGVVQVKAKANPGYTFLVWEGNLSGTDTVQSITMNAKKTVKAKFKPLDTVAAPTFSPPEGTYASTQNVTIGCTTVGATIRFTRNGSDPTESDSAYSRPVVVQSTTTLKAKAFKSGWAPSASAGALYTITPTAVHQNPMDGQPADFVLDRNYPNPFNPETRIRYELPKDVRVHLAVYGTGGNLIRTLEDGERSAGTHVAVWNGTNETGRTVSSGIYLFKMTAGDRVFVRKMSFVK